MDSLPILVGAVVCNDEYASILSQRLSSSRIFQLPCSCRSNMSDGSSNKASNVQEFFAYRSQELTIRFSSFKSYRSSVSENFDNRCIGAATLSDSNAIIETCVNDRIRMHVTGNHF